MADTHPLALAYLRAAAEAHHARGHVVPTGMPSPRAAMRRARDAWQRAGCPVEAEAPSSPVAVPCALTNNDGWTGPGVVLRVTSRHIFAAPKDDDRHHGLVIAYHRKTGKSTGRRYWRGISVVDPEAAAAAWLRANGGAE